MSRDIGATWDICLTLNRWGRCYLQQKTQVLSKRKFNDALETAKVSGFQEHIARALHGLAYISAQEKNFLSASQLGKNSLKIFEKMQHRKGREVKEWLLQIQPGDENG